MINVNMTSSDGVTLNTSGKYCEDNIKVTPTFDISDNFKQFDITISFDLNDLVEMLDETFITGDSWVAQNYDKSSLNLVLRKNSTVTESTKNVILMHSSNSPLYQSYYGVVLRQPASANEPAGYLSEDKANCDDPLMVPVGLWVNSNGNVGMTCQYAQGFTLSAGSYTLTMWY